MKKPKRTEVQEMSSNFAITQAASAWTKPNTCNIEMDTKLAQAFAEIVDELTSRAWLGNATTGELLDELRARCEVNGTIGYSTVEREAQVGMASEEARVV